MKQYYVMLMPNDDYLVALVGSSTAKNNEKDAIDCWRIEAETQTQAVGKVLHNLYNQARDTWQ